MEGAPIREPEIIAKQLILQLRYWIEAQDPVGDSESLQPLILGSLVVW